MKELGTIQVKLKAPKGQYNKFGNYNYRSCEDILEALKPLLEEQECILTLTDEPIVTEGWHFIKATVTLTNKDGKSISTTAYAREEESKKGMDASQITGTASSYARKYALNGLFCIDDTKDADATNTHGKEDKKANPAPTAVPQTAPTPTAPPVPAPVPTQTPIVIPADDSLENVIEMINKAKTADELTAIWKTYASKYKGESAFMQAFKDAPANPKRKK